MPVFSRKYNWAASLFLLFFLQGFLWSSCGRMSFSGRGNRPAENHAEESAEEAEPAGSFFDGVDPRTAQLADSLMDHGQFVLLADSVAGSGSPASEALTPVDSLDLSPADSLSLETPALYSLAQDSSLRFDSLGQRDYGKQFLDDPIFGNNRDSVVYDVVTGMIYIYNDAEVTYQDKILEADFMTMHLGDKMIYARGVPDTLGIPSRPVFNDAGKDYAMDSILYNLNTGKAKIKGVWTTEGDGILRGQVIKKMPDNTINVAHGIYSTCDEDHPHYYIEMTKAKAIPGKKAVFGYSYLVMEDVPLYFLGLPFGFFPLNSEKSSGFIIPSFGEESSRGFYIRDGGYYLVPNDYMDITLLGGIYTLGSWETKVNTRYKVRYKFNGGFNFQYNSTKFGDKGSSDYQDTRTFQVQWTHSQDPKFRPGSTFSASANFSSTQNNRYSPTTINDYATNQTSSSISYQKSWTGTPFSMGVSMAHTQVNRDSTYSFTFPNFTFNMSRISPFKFKGRKPGPERWYEKITMSYSGSGSNQVSNVKEYDLLKKPMWDKMNTQMSHTIPVSASFTVLNYINLSPSVNYREYWNTKKTNYSWDPETESVLMDTVKGFHRTYNYSTSLSASTTIYGMYDNFGPKAKIQALRHTLNPTLSMSFTPGFGDTRFFSAYQTNASGDYRTYSPYSNAPPENTSASLNFSLSQTLEAKVRTKRDSIEKKSIIDQLSFSFSYNFMADSMKLSQSVPVTLRSTLIKGFNINLTTSLGLYEVDRNGRAYNELLWSNGKPPRVETLSTSFNWSRSFGRGNPNARNAGTNMVDDQNLLNNMDYYDPFDPLNMTDDPTLHMMQQQDQRADMNAYRNLLSSQYYDFDIPLNINFSYSINYRNNGATKTITQTTSFGGSVNLTPKWGMTVQSGYDFQAKKIVNTTNFTLTRDLHCWQMNFSWVPLGPMKSWNFLISVKANVLRDLKYEKRGSRWDEINYRR